MCCVRACSSLRLSPGQAVGAITDIELVTLKDITASWQLRERPDRRNIATIKERRVGIGRRRRTSLQRPSNTRASSLSRSATFEKIISAAAGVTYINPGNVELAARSDAVEHSGLCVTSANIEAVLRITIPRGYPELLLSCPCAPKGPIRNPLQGPTKSIEVPLPSNEHPKIAKPEVVCGVPALSTPSIIPVFIFSWRPPEILNPLPYARIPVSQFRKSHAVNEPPPRMTLFVVTLLPLALN